MVLSHLACNVALLHSKSRHNSGDFEYGGQYSILSVGGGGEILANFITFYHLVPLFLAKILKFFHLSFKIFCGYQSAMSNRQKDWLIQEQTALGKDISNPLTACNLPKIVWYLNSPYPKK
jgi:hypothetical protein